MLGLFAKEDLTPYEYIGPYSGDLVPKRDIKDNKISGKYTCEIDTFYQQDIDSNSDESDGDNDEVCEQSSTENVTTGTRLSPRTKRQVNYNDNNDTNEKSSYKFAIDASDPFSCFGRYANCPPVGQSNNAYLHTVNHTSQTRHKALEVRVGAKKIFKDNEIYVNYGKQFWNNDILMRSKRDPRRKLREQLGDNEQNMEQAHCLLLLEEQRNDKNDENDEDYYNMNTKQKVKILVIN
jgi:hypothetical protein